LILQKMILLLFEACTLGASKNKKDGDEFILQFYYDSFYPEFLNGVLRTTRNRSIKE
jgi:hypothetical protein